jgi:hypothetical protein
MSWMLSSLIALVEHFADQFSKLGFRAAEQFLARRGNSKILAAFSVLDRGVADKVAARLKTMQNGVQCSRPQVVPMVPKLFHDLDAAYGFLVRVVEDVQAYETSKQVP